MSAEELEEDPQRKQKNCKQEIVSRLLGLRRKEQSLIEMREPHGPVDRPAMHRGAQTLVLRIPRRRIVCKYWSKEVVLLPLSATRMAHNSEICLTMCGHHRRRTKRTLLETNGRRETRIANQRIPWRVNKVKALVSESAKLVERASCVESKERIKARRRKGEDSGTLKGDSWRRFAVRIEANRER